MWYSPKKCCIPAKQCCNPAKKCGIPKQKCCIPSKNVVLPQKICGIPPKQCGSPPKNVVFHQKYGLPQKRWYSPKWMSENVAIPPTKSPTNRENPWPWIHLPKMNGLRFFNGFNMLNKQHKVSKHK